MAFLCSNFEYSLKNPQKFIKVEIKIWLYKWGMQTIFDCSKTYVWMAMKKVSFIALALKPEYLLRGSLDYFKIFGRYSPHYMLPNVWGVYKSARLLS